MERREKELCSTNLRERENRAVEKIEKK